MKNQLKGKKIAILVTDGFEESELLEPQEALHAAGAQTVVVSPKKGEFVQGMHHDEPAGSVRIDIPLEAADPEKFDGLLLPGGAINADALRTLPEAQDFLYSMEKAVKPVAFICHAPWLLVSANLVRGRTLTSYPSIRDDIRNAGGRWVDREVVRDGNWVSSRNPDDLPAFNREMIDLFADKIQYLIAFAA